MTRRQSLLALITLGGLAASPTQAAAGFACPDASPQSHAVIARPAASPTQLINLATGGTRLLATHRDDIVGIAVDAATQRVYARAADDVIYVSDAVTGAHIETAYALAALNSGAGGGLDTRCGRLLADVDVGGPRVVEIDPITWTIARERRLPVTRGERVGALAHRAADDAVLLIVESLNGAVIRTVDTAGRSVAEHPLPAGVQATALELEQSTGELIGVVNAGDALARSMNPQTGRFGRTPIGRPHGDAGGLALTHFVDFVPPHDPPPPPPQDQPRPPQDPSPPTPPVKRPTTGDGWAGFSEPPICVEPVCGLGCENIEAALQTATPDIVGLCEVGFNPGACPDLLPVTCPADLSEQALQAAILEALAEIDRLQRIVNSDRAAYRREGVDDNPCLGVGATLEKTEARLHNLIAEMTRRALEEIAALDAQGCGILEAVRNGMKQGGDLLIQLTVTAISAGTMGAAYASGGAAEVATSFFNPSASDFIINSFTTLTGTDTLPTDIIGALNLWYSENGAMPDWNAGWCEILTTCGDLTGL